MCKRILILVLCFPFFLYADEEALEEAVSEPERTAASEEVVYRPSPLHFAIDIHFSPTNLKKYQWMEVNQFDKRGDMVQASFEWIPVKKIGKIGIGIGGGYYWMSHTNDVEGFDATLWAIPAEAFLDYRLDYYKGQPLVPFVKVGGGVIFVKQEITTTVVTTGPTNTYYGFNYSAGAALLLNWFEPSTARNLDNHYGINNSYLVFEYFKSSQLGEKKFPDLSREEYRVGVRVEF